MGIWQKLAAGNMISALSTFEVTTAHRSMTLKSYKKDKILARATHPNAISDYHWCTIGANSDINVIVTIKKRGKSNATLNSN